jgi:hypothetical protein
VLLEVVVRLAAFPLDLAPADALGLDLRPFAGEYEGVWHGADAAEERHLPVVEPLPRQGDGALAQRDAEGQQGGLRRFDLGGALGQEPLAGLLDLDAEGFEQHGRLVGEIGVLQQTRLLLVELGPPVGPRLLVVEVPLEQRGILEDVVGEGLVKHRVRRVDPGLLVGGTVRNGQGLHRVEDELVLEGQFPSAAGVGLGAAVVTHHQQLVEHGEGLERRFLGALDRHVRRRPRRGGARRGRRPLGRAADRTPRTREVLGAHHEPRYLQAEDEAGRGLTGGRRRPAGLDVHDDLAEHIRGENMGLVV